MGDGVTVKLLAYNVDKEQDELKLESQ